MPSQHRRPAPSPLTIPSYTPAHDPTSSTAAAFLCTICWQSPPPPNKPKLLGTAARIVCAACWRAVLDLSICWVCGECIVRGDEVVSLGWCFWHGGCFGCLLCGVRLSVDEVHGSWEGGWAGRGEGVGVGSEKVVGTELETIPLCKACEAEVVGEGREGILERGLQCVDAFDGGLSRERLARKLERESGDVPCYIMRRKRGELCACGDRWVVEGVVSPSPILHMNVKRSRGVERSSEARWDAAMDTYAGYLSYSELNDDLYKSNDHAVELRFFKDGSADPPDCPSVPEAWAHRMDSEDKVEEVYLSIFDPLGQPAFRPSKTKPLPKWMRLLPSNVHREREFRAAMADQRSGEAIPLETASNFQLRESISEDDEVTPTPGSMSSPVKSKAEDVDNSTVPPIDIVPSAFGKRTSITFADEVSFRRSRDNSSRQSQATNRSVYLTPPEYPSPLRQRTPFPCQVGKPPAVPEPLYAAPGRRAPTPFPPSRPYVIRDDTCYLSAKKVKPNDKPSGHNRLLAGEVEPFPFSPRSSSPSSRTRGRGTSYTRAGSSEYLERYQPKQLPAKSRTYTAKEPGPIMARFKRQKTSKLNRTEVSGDKKGKSGTAEQDVGRSPGTESLQRELKSLFSEK